MKQVKYKTEEDILKALEEAATDCYSGKIDPRAAQVIVSSCNLALEALKQQRKRKEDEDSFLGGTFH